MDMIQLLPILIIFIVMLVLLFVFIKKNESAANQTSTDSSEKKQHHEADVLKDIEVLKLLLPLRIQASERLVLLLERMQPRLLISRHIQNPLSALALAQNMLSNIREEFEHNLSQQLYVSDTAWQMVKTSKEEVVQLIHLTLSNIKPDADAADFAKDLLSQEAPELIDHAIRRLRDELNATGLKS